MDLNKNKTEEIMMLRFIAKRDASISKTIAAEAVERM